MPLHHVSLVQQLLIRTGGVVLETLYQPRLERLPLGAMGCADCMIGFFSVPTFVMNGFQDVVARLNHADYPFDAT